VKAPIILSSCSVLLYIISDRSFVMPTLQAQNNVLFDLYLLSIFLSISQREAGGVFGDGIDDQEALLLHFLVARACHFIEISGRAYEPMLLFSSSNAAAAASFLMLQRTPKD
jgi:hypothetical protein